MNNARDVRHAAQRCKNRVLGDTVASLGEAEARAEGRTDGGISLTSAIFYESLRKANRAYKSRRAGLAGRKTRRQQRR